MHLRKQKALRALESEVQRLGLSLELERNSHAEKLESMEAVSLQLQQTFSSLSQQALKSNNENFLRLAKEKLSQYQIQAEASLEKKEKAIEPPLPSMRP